MVNSSEGPFFGAEILKLETAGRAGRVLIRLVHARAAPLTCSPDPDVWEPIPTTGEPIL